MFPLVYPRRPPDALSVVVDDLWGFGLPLMCLRVLRLSSYWVL